MNNKRCYHCKKFDINLIKKRVDNLKFKLCEKCNNSKCFCGRRYSKIQVITFTEEPKLRFICDACIRAVHF